MTTRLGLIGLDSSHAEDFLRHFNREARHKDICITAIAGGDRARMDELESFAPGLDGKMTTAELIDAVDAVIVGHRDGDLHRAAAIASLEARRPTFVDKPLSNSLADAEAIVDASVRHDAPLLSGSALRWQAETTRLKARLAGIDGGFDLLAYGTWYPDSEYGGPIFYAIHTVELVLELLGTDWKELTLEASASPKVRFRSGGRNVTLEFRPLGSSGHSDFGVEVASKEYTFRQPILLGDDYMAPVASRIAQMLTTGRSPLSPDELLAPIRLMRDIEGLLRPRA